MNPRVALVAARYGDPWDDLSVVASRLAGALACNAEVDVILPAAGITATEEGRDGACRVLRFPATSSDDRRRRAWRSVAFGSRDDHDLSGCICSFNRSGRDLPAQVEEQVVLAEGGDSPPLYAWLSVSPYDVVVFVGFHFPASCFGARHVRDGSRVFVVPGMWDEAAALLRIHDFTFDRAERILVLTEAERSWIGERARVTVAERVENVGFLLGVNRVVSTAPTGPGFGRNVVIARDWRSSSSIRRRSWVSSLARALPQGVRLRLVGPGAGGFADGVPHTDARIDAWWWMSRALAVIDPARNRVLGQELLEAMLFGVPVVVAADGGASREHAEVGNGCLWYRIEDELVGCIDRLLHQEDLRSVLGEQGRSYAEKRFADTETFVKRVSETILAKSA